MSRIMDIAITLAVSGVTTLNMYLSGALTIALPTIGEDLDFKQSDLQWPVSIYSLSYGCLLLFFGHVGDIVGPRLMFLCGSAWFAGWSIATAFAPNYQVFILFVALKGVGAAANTPAALGLVVEHFPPGAGRNRALGILGAFQPIGWILGLVLGGVLTGSCASWRAIFYIQTGLTIFFGLIGFLVFKTEHRGRRYRKGLDWGGAILSTSGIGLLTYSLADSTSAVHGWGTPRIPALFITSLLLLVLFGFYEQYRERRNFSVLLPPSMWSRPGARMPAMMCMVFFGWWSFNALMYWCTLYFQQVLLLSPIQTSIRFIPLVVSAIIVNLVAGLVMHRIPGQPLMLIGLLGNVAAPLIYALIDTRSSYWSMAFIIMIVNAGADVAYPIGTLHLLSSFDENSQSLAGGVFNVATRLGTSLGVVISSSIATATSQKYLLRHPASQTTSPEVLMAGFRAAGWTCFAAGVMSVIIILVGLRGIGIVGTPRAESADKKDENSENTEKASAMGIILEENSTATGINTL
ncbi:major facilitator superfamily domain-containing protein [Mycena floridula]|nr:major facilitator superfamily domain-containing protein [Mycena floridula]